MLNDLKVNTFILKPDNYLHKGNHLHKSKGLFIKSMILIEWWHHTSVTSSLKELSRRFNMFSYKISDIKSSMD